MKMYLIALIAFSAGATLGQTPGPEPPQTGTCADARAGQLQKRLRQPPPAGGFWVIEETLKRPAIAHFYADSQQEIRTDTLRRGHLNLKKRAVVERLNERLMVLLDDRPVPASVAVRQP